MVKQFLNVIDREQMFSVHRNDDGVPDLRNKDLS